MPNSDDWLNLLRSDFKLDDNILRTSGIDIRYEPIRCGFFNAFEAIKPEQRITTNISLMSMDGRTVTIDGDEKLVYAILEKLK